MARLKEPGPSMTPWVLPPSTEACQEVEHTCGHMPTRSQRGHRPDPLGTRTGEGARPCRYPPGAIRKLLHVAPPWGFSDAVHLDRKVPVLGIDFLCVPRQPQLLNAGLPSGQFGPSGMGGCSSVGRGIDTSVVEPLGPPSGAGGLPDPPVAVDPLTLATLGGATVGATLTLATLGAAAVGATLATLGAATVAGLLLGGDPLVVVSLEVLLKTPVDFDVVVGFVLGSSLDGLFFFLFHIITNTTTAIVITTKITMGSGVEDAWTTALFASDQKRGARRECEHSQRSATATGGLIRYDC